MSLEQVIINGIVIGLLYCLISLGITLIYSILDILNFAHGQMYVLGGVIVYFLCTYLNINYFIALILIIPILGLIGIIFDRFLFRRLRKLARSHASAMLLAIGSAIFIEEFILLTFGEKDKGVTAVVSGVFNVFGMRLSAERLLVCAISILLVGTFFYFVRYTRTGRAMRALAQDPEAAYLQGVDINRVSWVGFGIGAALAGIAGGLVAPIFGVSPGIGGPMTLKCFLIMMIGGFGSVGGSVAGAFILGFCESIGYTLLPGTYTFLIIYIAIILLLLVRPQGLMGKK
jgi:branched-chain amino acid transport system permease protein